MFRNTLTTTSSTTLTTARSDKNKAFSVATIHNRKRFKMTSFLFRTAGGIRCLEPE